MNLHYRKFRWVYAISIILFLACGFFLSQQSSGLEEGALKKSTYFITLTSDGFYPSRITIRKGDTIRFATILEKPFWPASDSHPAHTNYPEFDPQRPLEPRETFEFVFEKEGRWGYHNHLAPGEGGVIVVSSASSSFIEADQCDKEERGGLCGRRYLENIIREGGIEAGFAVFKRESILADQNTCHPLAHELGKIAYHYMKEKKDVPLNDETSFCSFGFWHGFMDALTRSTKEENVFRAQEICMQMEERDALLKRHVAANCWHGLGLASVGDPPDLAVWGDVHRMTEKAILFCEKVGTTDAQRAMCAEGVFHSEIIYMTNQQYGLSFDLAHPLAFCDAQKKYKNECYREIAPYFPSIIHPMLTAEDSLLEDIDGDMRREFIKIATAAWVRYKISTSSSVDAFVRDCEVFEGNEKESCIEGILDGLFNKDEERGYVLPLSLCGSSRLTEGEQQSCYSHFGAVLQGLLSDGERRKICEHFPLAYRNKCF